MTTGGNALMTFYEAICFAKVYGAAMGQLPFESVSNREKEITAEVLKKMADQRNDWPDELKGNYKLIVDYVKNM